MRPDEPYLTTKAFVERFRQVTGADLRLSRFHKDRATGVAPKPVARFGNRDLFNEGQIAEYAKAVIKPMEPGQDEAT